MYGRGDFRFEENWICTPGLGDISWHRGVYSHPLMSYLTLLVLLGHQSAEQSLVRLFCWCRWVPVIRVCRAAPVLTPTDNDDKDRT